LKKETAAALAAAAGGRWQREERKN
jgi:hypothetical protein